MHHNMEDSFESVHIKPLGREDIELLRKVRNREDVRAWFFYSDVISSEQQEAWYERYLKEPNDYMFSVFSKKTGKWVGAAALYHIDVSKGQAEFGRLLIDPACPERGLGKATVRGVCTIGFEQLGLQSFFLEVFADNKPAFTCYERVGFHVVCRSERNGRQTYLMELDRNSFNSYLPTCLA